jgi:hypothetical protein
MREAAAMDAEKEPVQAVAPGADVPGADAPGADAPGVDTPGVDVQQPLTLRIVAGRHAGAITQLVPSEMLVIGASDDCDVILSDAGVAPHHCVLTRHDARLVLRTIDAALTLNGQVHRPGETISIAPDMTVVIGGAAFEVRGAQRSGDPGIEDGNSIPSASTDTARRRLGVRSRHSVDLVRRFRWAIVGALPLAVAVASVLRPAMHAVSVEPAPSATDSAATLRSGAAIAHDVTEVLRLSGISCEATYNGDGTVTVRGNLGNQRALAAVIESRAMREIVGLKRVLTLNLDHAGESGLGVDGTRIVSAVSSGDPYVITADGSRYYVGAPLPQGGRLTGVHDGEVLIDHDGHVEHLKLSGGRSGG